MRDAGKREVNFGRGGVVSLVVVVMGAQNLGDGVHNTRGLVGGETGVAQRAVAREQRCIGGIDQSVLDQARLDAGLAVDKRVGVARVAHPHGQLAGLAHGGDELGTWAGAARPGRRPAG